MPTLDTYDIVFKKLAEAAPETLVENLGPTSVGLSSREFDEIDELRRLALELQDPEPQSFTTT